jgi:uncharacterized protein YPO0396
VDWGSVVVEKVAAPALTAVGGFVGAALRFQRRLKTIEDDFEAFRTKVVGDLESARTSWRGDLADHKAELEEKICELRQKLERIEDGLHKFQKESTFDFAKDAELVKFIEEQHREWKQMQRTLGQIEGMLRTMK